MPLVEEEDERFFPGVPTSTTSSNMTARAARVTSTTSSGEHRPWAIYAPGRDASGTSGPLAAAGRRLVCSPGDAVEDAVGLLVGAAARMVGSEVLQGRPVLLALRGRKLCGGICFVHLSEQIEKATAKLSVELIGRRPLVLHRRLLRGGPA